MGLRCRERGVAGVWLPSVVSLAVAVVWLPVVVAPVVAGVWLPVASVRGEEGVVAGKASSEENPLPPSTVEESQP